MRVFLAGATGAIGRPLVLQLIEAGHEVVGTTRSEERAAELRAKGAEPAVLDVRDPDALRAAILAARPDAVLHQLTDLPKEFSPRYDYGSTIELHSDVTRVLIDAAREAGARRVVAQSIAFIYRPTGPKVKDEDAPVLSSEVVGGRMGEAADAILDLEEQVVTAEGIEGLVLRYGFFYGPGTWFTEDTRLAKTFRRRMSPIVGKGEGVFSFIHVEDAASATVAALTRGEPGIYNVVDDDPAPARDWMPEFAAAIGAKPPRRVPAWLARVAGGSNGKAITVLRGASNAKARRELGWEPRYPSWRQGFREGLT